MNMSQSEFATYFNIPVRTLQKWEQEEAIPAPYLIKLIKEYADLHNLVHENRFNVNDNVRFKPVKNIDFKNIIYIHPSQQKRVFNIINELKNYKEVKKIIIFGSSISYKCNEDSDIDMYVELSKDINVKTYNVDCPVDYWDNYNVDPDMFKHIKAKGVLVYDC